MTQYWVLIAIILVFFGWYLYEHSIRSISEGVTFISKGSTLSSLSNEQKAQLLQVTNSSISKSTNEITITGSGPPNSQLRLYYASPSSPTTAANFAASTTVNGQGNFTVNVQPNYISKSNKKMKLPLPLKVVATIPIYEPSTATKKRTILTNITTPNTIVYNYVVPAQ